MASLTKFTITHYYHEWSGDDLTLRIITDVLCHTFINWMDRPAPPYPSTKVKRGLRVPAARWPTDYKLFPQPQDEPGDTFQHTHHLFAWTSNQVKSFIFKARIAGVFSNSDGPVFQIRKGQIGPPAP